MDGQIINDSEKEHNHTPDISKIEAILQLILRFKLSRRLIVSALSCHALKCRESKTILM